MTSDIDC